MMTIPDMIAVLQSAKDGKKIERRTHGESEWWKLAIEYEDWNFSKYDFRIAPEPKHVPLGPQDVPPGSVVRHKNWLQHTWSPCCPVELGVIVVAQPANMDKELLFLSWFCLTQGWQISRDGGKTWQPCWKEEV